MFKYPPIHRSPLISIDIETVDPDLKSKGPGVRRTGYIVGVGVATDREAFYYPLRHDDGPNAPIDVVYRWLREELGTYKSEIITANGLYDADYLSHEGIVWPCAIWRDVQIAEAIINAERGKYKLELLAKHYLGEGKRDDTLAELYGADWIKRFNEVAPQLAMIYCKGDVEQTRDIWLLQKPVIQASRHFSSVMDLETRLLPMLLYMRRLGVPINAVAANALSDRFYLEELALKDKIKKETGIEPRWNASRNLATICDKYGIKYGLTPTGQPQINKEFFTKCDHPVVKDIDRARRINKMRTTFINGSIIGGSVNGRIHCEFKPTKSDTGGTVTGRLSSAHPGLHSTPSRDEEMAPLIRGCFVPEDGQTWWSLDWSQIEYRLLVHYAFLEKLPGAAEAVQLFRDDPNTDYHQFVMDLTGLARKAAKGINFGRIYGMGKESLRKTLDVTMPEALEIIAKYNEHIPYADAMLKCASNRASTRGYIRTLAGRIHHFDRWQSRDFDTGRQDGAFSLEDAKKKYSGAIQRAYTYKALNYLLQGTAADIMKKAMVDIWEAGLTTAHGGPLSVFLTVHDELDGSVLPDSRGVEAYLEAKHIMETSTKLSLPILADGELGPDWGHLKSEEEFFNDYAK